jgi:hypothetical protein
MTLTGTTFFCFLPKLLSILTITRILCLKLSHSTFNRFFKQVGNRYNNNK